MLDSTSMFKESDNALEIGERCFENCSELVDRETGEVKLVGRLGNLRLKATGSGLSISGSLAKFQNGSNLTPLSRSGVQEAIERLSDTLGVNVGDAKVYRLDVGESLYVREPVQTYLTCLGEAPNYNRSTFGSTVLYANGRRSLSFYDKVAELKRRKEPMPEVFKGRHFLRYEIQLKQRLPDLLKVPEIRALSLYDEDFYISLIDRWKAEYFRIQRVSKLRIKPDMSFEVKDFVNALACLQVKAFGENEVLSMIEGVKQEGRIDRFQAKRLKDKIKELANLPDLTEPEPAILELDQKVRQAARHYR